MIEESIIRTLESLSMTKGENPKIVVHIALGVDDLYILINCLEICAEKSDDFDCVAEAVDFARFFKHCKYVASQAKKQK